MSDLTSCNFCKLNQMKKTAKAEGKKVTLLRDAKWGMGGINVYIHPKGIDIKKMDGGEDGKRAKYRAAWFMSIGKRCEC